MSEGKNSGAKYRNKQKYKNKAKVIPKTKETNVSVDDGDKIIIDDDYPYRRRGLESNWHRYEIKDEVEDIVDVARDFSAIVSAPVSQGNYFQFKSDKNLDNFEEEQIESQIFKIDMNLLGLSLLSLPFHIRCNIDEKHFSEDELNISYATAQKAKEQYAEALKDLDEKKLKTEIDSDEIQRDNTTENKNKENVPAPSKREDIKENKEWEDETSGNKEQQDLEDWLDDILDD